MREPDATPKSEPGRKAPEADKKNRGGDSGKGSDGKSQPDRNDKNNRPDRGEPGRGDKNPGERARAERQRADQERKARETRQRVNDASSGKARENRNRDGARTPDSQKGRTTSKYAKESGEAASQKSESKTARHKPEKSNATSPTPNRAGRNTGSPLTKTQQEIEKLARDPSKEPELVRSEIGGMRPEVKTITSPDGSVSRQVSHLSSTGEKTFVNVKQDRSGRTETFGATFKPDGTFTKWTRDEVNGVSKEGTIIEKGEWKGPRHGDTVGVEGTRLYSAHEANSSAPDPHGEMGSHARRPEKAPGSNLRLASPEQPRPSSAEEKTSRPRPEYSKDRHTSPDDPSARSGRHFGHVPNDYVERPHDYEVHATFERIAGEEGGTLSIERGLVYVTAPVHSGITRIMTDLGSIPIPLINEAPAGTYDLLRGGEQKANEPPSKFRLEKHDGIYGNDEADGPFFGSGWMGFKDLNELRLHKEGESLGCVTSGRANGDRSPEAKQAWEKIHRIIGLSPAGKRNVWKYDRYTKSTIFGYFRREDVDFFGTLTIKEKPSPKKRDPGRD